jgi:hypothetical protein
MTYGDFLLELSSIGCMGVIPVKFISNLSPEKKKRHVDPPI